MYRFQEISHLYALAIVPILVALFLWVIYWRKKRMENLGSPNVAMQQVLGYIKGRLTTKVVLILSALSLLIIGWANLQSGDSVDKVERKGVDVVIALDVSKSMLATDLQPNRLTRAKQMIMALTDKMRNDRVAFILFAGKSYLQVPLTSDYSAIKMMVQNATPSMVPTQGTVIGDAIEMAMQSFSQNEKKYKSLIIISDGEDHDEKATQLVQQAAEQGIIIHTVGVGSAEGATLIDPETNQPKLDENGNPVITKLNEDELRALASAGRGSYSQLRNAEEVADKLIASLEGMEQKNLGSVVYTDFTSYFQYFIALAIVLLVVEALIPGARFSKPQATK